MAGECATEPGLGGGRISDRRGSGEIESVSELSRPYGTSRPLEAGRAARASCKSSLTSLGGIVPETVPFRLPGFTIGDCRMRALPLADRGTFLLFVLLSLLVVSCCIVAGSPKPSMSTSTGEWPVELPDVVFWDWWCGCCWFCAWSAGDVRGLK
jgi:hypothetical protein